MKQPRIIWIILARLLVKTIDGATSSHGKAQDRGTAHVQAGGQVTTPRRVH